MNSSSSTNHSLELAFDYVAHTDRNIFLTGKAGTGKTTFLHRVRREVPKQMAVVAPTGVAAINAGAQTIHSLFSLPLGFLPPGRAIRRKRRISSKKIATLRAIDLLIIDEISMVRADVLDAIDATLQTVRGNRRAFGGVQVLMIGDLHQLPPVVTRDEVGLMDEHYATPYYFGARVLANAEMVSISLTHIYRQRDAAFIELLNGVRNNNLTDKTLSALNARYRRGFSPADTDGYITLTSHNATARRINQRRLAAREGQVYEFKATITGAFPPSMYPNDPVLHFKVGAQVMFNRNDSQHGAYYNGKIGRITAIRKAVIEVRCEGEPAPIQVHPITWDNVRYDAGGDTGAVAEQPIGSYVQHPLRLAYAITIHKSQGLTFEKVVIDAADSFTHGQVYVALSRCKTLEGVVLTSKLRRASVLTDRLVADHSRATGQNQPTPTELAEDRRRYQFSCLERLFDFQDLQRRATELMRLLTGPAAVMQGNGVREFAELREELQRGLIRVGQTFLPTLMTYNREDRNPETDPSIQRRLVAAATYYTNHLTGPLGKCLRNYHFLTDNTTLQAKLDDELQGLRLGYYLKQRCFEQMTKGYSAVSYTNTRHQARAEFDRLSAGGLTEKRPSPRPVAPDDIPHPELYEELRTWRLLQAKEQQMNPYRVTHNSVLVAICATLPVTERALLKINRVGRKTVERYGMDLLRMVKTYAMKHGHAGNQLTHLQQLSTVNNPGLQAMSALKKGIAIAEVAKRTGKQLPALYSEAVAWVRDGHLSPTDIFSPERLQALEDFTAGHTLLQIGVLAATAEGRFSVGELRLILTARSRQVAA